jgi:hypothetical protein
MAAVTRYHHKWDRRGRLLNAVQKLLAGIIIASDNSVSLSLRPRNADAERLYVRSKSMVARIKRELSRG